MKLPSLSSRKALFSVGALCLAALPPTAQGSAWPRADGELLILTPYSYTKADEEYDADGNRVDRSDFEMWEFSPMLEYGVTDNFTLGMQPKHRKVSLETPEGTITNSGFAETDLFARQQLWSRREAAISLEGLVKVPINPEEDSPAALGRDQVDAAIKLAYGNRHSVGGGRIFYAADTGYRRRWELPDDELSFNAFFGWSPGDSWSFILRSANVWGIGNGNDDPNADGDPAADEVLTAGLSYVRHDAQLMASYRFQNAMTLVGGVSSTYAGEDVGVGKSAFLAMTLQY